MSMSKAAPTSWRLLCPTGDVEEGMPRRVVVDGLPPLAVFRLEDGYFVIADTCTHGQASLFEGFVEGDQIECPWHSGRFCIRDGKAMGAPAVDDVRAWPATVIDGQVAIDPSA
jgi:nitrite reductase/ring-hydroxylating ferredoxin subunit